MYQTQSTNIIQPQQTQPYQQNSDQQLQFTDQGITFGDTIVDELASDVENLRLYESTRYIGEGSLLMLDEGNNEEMIIPQMQPDLSKVDNSLKILPNLDVIKQLIELYFKYCLLKRLNYLYI